tara:strand:- start:956 stop:1264 length:309 start_codon:yes stop_codon:yes gene_type:complete
MDLRKKYSIVEFENMQESLIGSLVSFYSPDDTFHMLGKGILTNLRIGHGCVYARIFWTKSPFFNHKEERKFGWHSIDRLFILQNKFGTKNYACQSNPHKRKI